MNKSIAPIPAPCPAGVAELAGTGFEDPGVYCGDAKSSGGGATGWLTRRTRCARLEHGHAMTSIAPNDTLVRPWQTSGKQKRR